MKIGTNILCHILRKHGLRILFTDAVASTPPLHSEPAHLPRAFAGRTFPGTLGIDFSGPLHSWDLDYEGATLAFKTQPESPCQCTLMVSPRSHLILDDDPNGEVSPDDLGWDEVVLRPHG